MIGELRAPVTTPVVVRSLVLIISIVGLARTDILPTVVPTFVLPISNVTVPVGREAVLACTVDDLSNYKVAWLQVNTQTILTIAIHVITKNHRISVSHSDHRIWYLHIRDVRESDQGDYMCQINTDPMISQVGQLKVVVPPDILDYPTSTDMVVREGSNVTLRCAASGSPQPNITWKRESGEHIVLGANDEAVSSVNGSTLNITRVNRLHMGAYLCIASNGVPPTVSKRIMLIVHFPPMIMVQNQLVGAQEGQNMTLECHSEAYPKAINYWTRENNLVISNDEKYESSYTDSLQMDAYKVHMKLTIKKVELSDYGSYKCISKNSLGSTDGTIKLYRIETPTTLPEPSTTTPVPPTVVIVESKPKPRQKVSPTVVSNFNEIIDASKTSESEKRGAQLRERPKTNAKSGRKKSDDRSQQTDEAARSMSSRSAGILSITRSNFALLTITLTAFL
ncbi:opioid-binding protein/cell adhesion molecule homolog isoform X3 [Microplitis mediator]|uniref:opioid-binding protein/cell adhesion molecule homolog isoform X3 n=1 Tax=Microplitis mediator TaxID=375433 RepID=UPI0025526995|nr:opioid-binding protein/cell adhesion molecule homolog isoform X3 [Microplitis mediator]